MFFHSERCLSQVGVSSCCRGAQILLLQSYQCFPSCPSLPILLLDRVCEHGRLWPRAFTSSPRARNRNAVRFFTLLVNQITVLWVACKERSPPYLLCVRRRHEKQGRSSRNTVLVVTGYGTLRETQCSSTLTPLSRYRR